LAVGGGAVFVGAHAVGQFIAFHKTSIVTWVQANVPAAEYWIKMIEWIIRATG
jgi:uncharacterized membrane protein